jgi:signal transduction histidine kinase
MLRRFGLFWTVVLYGALAASLYDFYRQQPLLFPSWSLVGLLGFVVAFCISYHWLYLAWWEQCEWPMPLARALIYLALQVALLTGMLHYTTSFVGLGFALIGQVFSILPPKQWPVPLLALTALMIVPIGVFNQVLAGDWWALVGFVFLIVSLVAISAFTSTIISQRFALQQVVHELRHAKEQLERQAAQTEELAMLRERTRLAREMHDSLGHALVVVNVKLEAAQRLYAKNDPRGPIEIEATRALVRETMTDLRRSLADLRAPLTQDRDLAQMLAHAAAEVRARTKLDITCDFVPDLPDLAPEQHEALWRVVREALTNVEKHAAAASVTLRATCNNRHVVVQVVDDGSGVSPVDLKRPGHYGVIGMRERMLALGGTFQIMACPEGGTLVEARLPIE